MKKIAICLLALVLACALPIALFGCKGNKDLETYDPSKYTETIDLSAYTQVFFDDFNGELNREIWGDCRQGTRRTGFWTKNLAYTDGDGHLVIRTEKRGSRWCSDTREKQLTGQGGSRVTVKYDDGNPFGLIAGDFGIISEIGAHTEDLIGHEILAHFDALGGEFAAFMDKLEIPTDGTTYLPTLDAATRTTYSVFYDQAMELFNYYSFVVATKTVSTTLPQSAVIGANAPYAVALGKEIDPQTVDLRAAVARLFGFSSVSDFAVCAQALANTYVEYERSLAAGGNVNEGLENGCFRSWNGSYIFPIAIQNASLIVLIYVIVDDEGRVSVWVNDVAAVLRATNYSDAYYTGAAVNNEMYTRNILFVTGPEGVYSGAIRTRDLYTHGFGYYEIRCKLPSTVGIWHAFWLMCGDVYSVKNGSADGIEIDVFEYLPARDAVNCALHWDGYDEAHQNAHMRFETTGLADGNYHTFGMNWDENGYAFYIDGRKVWSSTGDGICPHDGYMIISTEYGEWGDWVGLLDPNFTAVDWIVDYVKVYEKVA